MRNTLYVGNLASHGDRRELSRLFAPYGTVLYAKVHTDQDMLHRRGGYGIVQMKTEEEAAAARRALDGSNFTGQMITVRWARGSEHTTVGPPLMFGPMNIPDQGEPDDLRP